MIKHILQVIKGPFLPVAQEHIQPRYLQGTITHQRRETDHPWIFEDGAYYETENRQLRPINSV